MKTVIWDVDDVLNDLMKVWLETWWRPTHPQCTLSLKDLTQNPPHGLLGVALAEYLASLDGFRASPRGVDIDPNPLCLKWFEDNGAMARHLALTSVPLWAAPLSAAWVMRHFGRWIRAYTIVPSSRAADDAPAYCRSKADAIAMVKGPLVFIDDGSDNVATARKAGIVSYLFPRPWNDAAESAADTLGRLADDIRSPK